jgi:hypothetical protein
MPRYRVKTCGKQVLAGHYSVGCSELEGGEGGYRAASITGRPERLYTKELTASWLGNGSCGQPG